MKWGLGVEHEVSLFTGRKDVTGAQVKAAFTPPKLDMWVPGFNPNVKTAALGHHVAPLKARAKFPALLKLPADQLNALLEDKTSKPWADAVDMDFSDTGPYVEFITPNFRNATVASVVKQLQDAQDGVVAWLKKAGTPVFMSEWGGWPLVLVRDAEADEDAQRQRKDPKTEIPPNIIKVGGEHYYLARDYNGSYHVNVTLPVRKPDFWRAHHAAMKALQWMSPLFVAAWGQPDVFSHSDEYTFTEGSFRLVTNFHSRMGSVDLQGPSRATLKRAKGRVAGEGQAGDWQPVRMVDRRKTVGHQTAAHKTQLADTLQGYSAVDAPQQGADFRRDQKEPFGFEFRILDHFPVEYLPDVLYILLLVCDHSAGLDPKDVPDARANGEWNELARQVFLEGWNAAVPLSVTVALWQALALGDAPAKPFPTALAMFTAVVDVLWAAHGGGKGAYTRHMVDAKQRKTKPRVVNLNKRAFDAYAKVLRMPPGVEDAHESVRVHK